MRAATVAIKSNLKVWILSMRLPFHSVGLVPFLLGVTLAVNHGYTISWTVLFFAAVAVFFIMLSTYFLGEYYDFETDRINRDFNRFSGGGRAFIGKERPETFILWGAYFFLFLAAMLGLLLHFYYKTGPLTIPLGLSGILCGMFYSARPFQWAYRGLGEIMIGFCYGWLPVSTGYYLMTGSLHPVAFFISLPVCLSIFNVILINEFPDYLADKAVGKKNLVVRFGPERMSFLYKLVTGAALLFFLLSIGLDEISPVGMWVLLPTLVLGTGNIIFMQKKLYQNKDSLEKICAGTILLNLIISFTYIITLL